MSDVEVLKAARAKIEQPEAWAQGHFAYRPPNGEPWRAASVQGGQALVQTNQTDPEAVCWCTLGAVMSVGRGNAVDDYAPLRYVLFALRDVTKAGPAMDLQLRDVVAFNDAPHRTHSEVLNLLDVAIQLAEADAEAGDLHVH